MVRCKCLTVKGTQCKNDAIKGSKTCAIHKKCKKAAPKARKASTKAKVAKSKAAPRTKESPGWVKSKAWESPVPEWMKGGEKIKTKAMSPQNADPWWLR